MADIRVSGSGEKYTVDVAEGGSSTTHEVTVPVGDLQRFGAGASAEQLLEESFRFLLERESKESILRTFDISVIATYFPEFPTEIVKRLS